MFCSCQHPDQQIILDKEKTFILNCYGDDQRPGEVNGSVVPENYFRAPNFHFIHSYTFSVSSVQHRVLRILNFVMFGFMNINISQKSLCLPLGIKGGGGDFYEKGKHLSDIAVM